MHGRRFLLLTAIAGTAMSVPFLYCRPRRGDWSVALQQPQLLSSICSTAEMHQIGEAYIDKIPSENDLNALYDKLVADNGAPIPGKATTGEIGGLLDKR